MNKTFKLHSGERQVGTNLSSIRKDHLFRYTLVADFLLEHDVRVSSGLDIFCGNGYGTYLLSSALDCKVTGIDGSSEAIQQANQYFSTDNTTFITKLFPSIRQPLECYDFVVSLESIEHIDNGEFFANVLIDSLKPEGYLFISAPNEDSLSLKLNPNKFHFRHFTFDDMTNVFSELELIDFYGQDTYILTDGVVTGYLPQDEMTLVNKKLDGQFLYYIFKK